jgi:hypothetical protein
MNSKTVVRRAAVFASLFVLSLAAAPALAVPPTLTFIGDQAVREGVNLPIALSASDADPGDSVSFSATGLPGFCLLTNGPGNNAGSINCSPADGDANTYSVVVTATDDSVLAEFTFETFDIVVTANSIPNLTNIDNQSAAEGVPLSIPLSATDSDGDALVFSFSSAPAAAFCSVVNNGNGTGSLNCSPLAGNAGTYNVTVTVTDNGPLPEQASDGFQLTVSANSPPVLTAIADQSVAEGGLINIPLSATDPDGDGMSFSFSSLPAGAQGFCSVNDGGNGTGSLNCAPQASDAGAYVVTVTVTDNGPVPAFASDAFTLSVTANSPPVLTAIPNQSVIEGASLNIPLSATDPDGDRMSFSILSVPPAGFCLLTDNTNGTGSIDCNPMVGDDGAYGITVTVTDDGPIPTSASDPFTLTVGANQPPTATNVTITGTPALGEVLTGSYTYGDAELDAEGVSTFRWLRDGIAIPGAITVNYTVATDDIETALRFEVTPVAGTGATQGTPVQSAEFSIANSPPSITGQLVLETVEDTPLAITLNDLTVADTDSTFPGDFTLAVQDGAGYIRSGVGLNTITPDPDFNGPLSVPVIVNDGFADSPVFNLLVTVTPVNDQPVFAGLVAPLSTPEDTSLTIVLANLIILDPDNAYPADFTLVLTPVVNPNANYTIVGDTSITPVENFNGQLNIGATVSDGELTSVPFVIVVSVEPVNDLPVLAAPIGPKDAIEDAPFNLDISTNFTDADGEALRYTATWLPAQPPNIAFDGANGVFSGTPRLVDTEAPGPVYQVTVTALDPVGEFVSDTFDLTISALGRANLGLSISVAPDTAMPGDDLRWTFTSRNPVGPVAGANVELAGSFVGSGLTVSVEGGASCTIEAEVNQATAFVCVLGALPVGGVTPIVFTTATSQATEVVAFATVEGTERVPIDPNLADNSALEAAGVAEAFSVGAVQNLGNSSIRSVAAGDVNGDGAADLVVGTAAGQSVQIFFNGAPRVSCQCLRDFLTAPISVPDTGSNEGVALADFDNNGSLDLVIANGGGQPDTVYSNDGAGNFVPMATLDPTFAQDVAVGDFDNDGDMDIAVAAIGSNPVYLGNGNGGFNLHDTLGSANSVAVAVARFDSNSRDDLVFANVGADSRVWTKDSGAGFTPRAQLRIGDATSVAAADLNGDGSMDLVFGRIPTDVGDIPANPVLLNQGSGTFGNPTQWLGISPTNDVHIGDVNQDGSPDLVFINDSAVHQIWTAGGGGYTLHREQIIDPGAMEGVLIELGDTDNNDPGGVDLAMGGAARGGLAVYLNDSFGNLGRGDAVPPVLTLLGDAAVSIQAKTNYVDAGASAADNIDGDISLRVTVSGSVNTSVVGGYILTYNVVDFAGNSADPITRNITVTPASGGGGGGGGTISYITLLSLLLAVMAALRYGALQNASHLRAERRKQRVL